MEKDVYLAPLPTKEEYFDVVVDFEQVVSLSNANNADARKRNEEEKQWLQPYNIPFKSFNVTAAMGKEKLNEIVNKVKALPRPLFIHGYFSKDEEMVRFKEAYLSSIKN